MGGSYEALDIFIQKWKESYPNYKSPYAKTSRLLE
jgi:hypothetical protein